MSKHAFYISNTISYLLPQFCWHYDAKKHFTKLSPAQQSYVVKRVEYALGSNAEFSLPDGNAEIADLGHAIRYQNCVIGDCSPKKRKTYFFDFYRTLKYFPKSLKFNCYFGDIRTESTSRAFVKTRPINPNSRSTLLKLNSVRHFQLPKDTQSFDDKIPNAVFRGACHTIQRQQFVERFFNHEHINAGCTYKKSKSKQFQKAPLSIQEQLKFKYVISIEGQDVATNLKWILNSKSACIMPKPTCESWLLEGQLKGGVHYIEVAPDFSDLTDKINYYNAHPDQVKTIVKNANEYITPYKNKDLEKLISYLVVARYLSLSGQLKAQPVTLAPAASPTF